MTDALEQAKQDFVQHITGDHVLSSVYEDLMAVRKNDGTNLMDSTVANKYNADLADFNATVQQYLPNFTLLGTLDGNHMLFSEKGVSDPINVDCSAAIPLKTGDLVTPSTQTNPLEVINTGVDSTAAKSDSTAVKNDSTANNPVTNTSDSTAISPVIPGDSTATKQPADSTAIKQPVDSTAIKQPVDSTGKQTAQTSDAAVAQITKDDQGFPTDIKYPAGADGKEHETKFEYDETAGFHRLVKVTQDDGTTYALITDPNSPDKGKWNVTDAQGKTTVQDANVQVAQNGDWGHYDNGVLTMVKADTTAKGSDETTKGDGTKDDGGTKGDGTKDDGNKGDGNKGDGAKPDAKEQAAKQALLDLATQKVGEGPWQAAERLLPGGSYHDLKALTHLLKAYFQEHNNDHTDKLEKLKVGNHWLTEDNFQEILDKSDALKKHFQDLQKN